MQIVRERLANQLLTGQPLADPVDVVRWQGAVQAQDYAGAKWAVGMRARGATDADVERAVERGEILRTHVLRPTWHFVLPEDIRWMLALTGPRIAQAMASYNRKFGLTPAVFRKSRAAIEKALRDGAHLTREELAAALAKAKVPQASGQLLAHMVMQAEIEGIICSGARRGRQFTYALLDLRAASCAPIDRDEALSRLAERYFRARGPATAHDFAWWSGLTMADARRAIEIRGRALAAIEVGGNAMWMVERDAPAPSPKGTAHLLSNYDEYFIGHRDRSAIGRRLGHVDPVSGGDGRIIHVVVVGGELVGGWRRATAGGRTVAAIEIGSRLTRAERALVDAERRRYEAFVG